MTWTKRRWSALIGIACLSIAACTGSDDQASKTAPDRTEVESAESNDEEWREGVDTLACLPLQPEGWTELEDLSLPTDIVLMASNDAHIVAIGRGADGDDASFHHSVDGLTWEQTDGVPGLSFRGPEVALAGGPNGFVVVGAAPPNMPLVAFSSDGTNWELIGPEGLPNSENAWFATVVAGADGFLVLGTGADPGSSTFIWHSDEGRSWTAAELPDLADGPATVTATDGGWVLLAANMDDFQGAAAAEVWTSNDGLQWTQVDTESAPLSAALFLYSGTAPLLAEGDTWMLAATGELIGLPSRPIVWVTTDGGVTWNEQAVTELSWGEYGLTGTATTDLGFMLAGEHGTIVAPDGEEHQHGFVHYSTDGVEWAHCWTSANVLGPIQPFGDNLVLHDSTFGDTYTWTDSAD